MPADVLRVLLAGCHLQREVLLLPVPQQRGLRLETPEGQKGSPLKGPKRLHEQVRSDRRRRRAIVTGTEEGLQLQED